MAKLFEYMDEYPLSAYFYEVSDGVVPKDIFYEVSQLANNRSASTLTFLGLKLHRKVSAAKKFIAFIDRSKVSLSIISGLVLLTIVITLVLKNIPEVFNISKNRRTKEKSITMGPEQVSKQKNNMGEIIATNEISQEQKEQALKKFETTKEAIEKLATELKKEGIEEAEIKRKLKDVLNNKKLDYSGAFENNNQDSKEALIKAIYNYQQSKNPSNARGFMNPPGAGNAAQTYKDLKQDIKAILDQIRNNKTTNY